MSIQPRENTLVVMGVTHQPDAFQGGREAAQIARHQLNSDKIDLVLALGQGDVHFQDFIEGVRLVTGEETLVGFPTSQIVANNIISTDLSVVTLLQTMNATINVASCSKGDGRNSSAMTALLTQLHQKHGTQNRRFQRRYLILLDNTEETGENPARALRFEAGLLAEVVAIKPPPMANAKLISQDNVVTNGFVVIEILANQPWGVSAINIGEFKNQRGVHAEAAKTIIRRALSQMTAKPAGGILISHCESEKLSSPIWSSIFQASEHIVPGLSVLGLATGDFTIHQVEQPFGSQKDSLAVILWA